MKATVLLVVMALALPHSANTQWTLVNCTHGIYELDFVNDSTGYVLAIDTATYYFHVLKTIDYGSTWDTVYTTWGALELQDLSFPSELVGYVSGGGMGYILKTIDGGENWVQQDISEVWEISTIEFQNELDGYGGSTDGYVSYVETHDGGETWEYNFDMGVRDVSIFDDCDVLLASGGDYYSNQNCVPWFSVYPNFGDGTFSSIERATPTDIHLGGLGWDGDVTFNYGVIAQSHDNGETWNFTEFPYLGGFYDLQFFGSIGYTVTENLLGNPLVDGYQTMFFKTTNGGETWNYQEFINETECQVGGANKISCVSEQVCYAIGLGGLFRTFNGGGELFPMPVGIAENSSLQKEVSLYPNPTSEILFIEYPSQINITSFQILDATGRSRLSGKLRGNEVDVSSLAPGLYSIVLFNDGREKVVRRFVKE